MQTTPTAEVIWPVDLALHQQAWELAKAALPKGTVREQIARQLDIMRELKGGK